MKKVKKEERKKKEYKTRKDPEKCPREIKVKYK